MDAEEHGAHSLVPFLRQTVLVALRLSYYIAACPCLGFPARCSTSERARKLAWPGWLH